MNTIEIAQKEQIRQNCMWWLAGWKRKVDAMTLGDDCAKIAVRAHLAVARSQSEFPAK